MGLAGRAPVLDAAWRHVLQSNTLIVTALPPRRGGLPAAPAACAFGGAAARSLMSRWRWRRAFWDPGRYLPDFLALLFPDAQAGIDWSQGYEFLDKELQQADVGFER